MNQSRGAAMRCLVEGRVQGVGYRAATRREAQRLGLTGWVRNLPDGRVELLASGSPEALDALERWLWQGPAFARVDGVLREAVAPGPLEGFAQY